MTASELDRIATLVQERTGLIFPESRSVVIEAGVRRAMAAARMADASRYAEALDQSPVLLDDLFAELTVGETYFFREPAQLEYIQREVLPRFQRLGRGVRVWSAGCATGEEPYTLSMMLHDADLSRAASVLGTDLSRARLRLAQRGEYRSWSMRGVPESAVERYFTVRDGRYEVSAPIKAPVEFRYLNLSADQFPSPAMGVWGVDLILCRNVLIYFDETAVRRVAAKLLDTLTEDGWLFLGASDPMLSELVPCDVVVTSAGLAYRRRGAARSVTGLISTEVISPESAFEREAIPSPATLWDVSGWSVTGAGSDAMFSSERGPEPAIAQNDAALGTGETPFDLPPGAPLSPAEVPSSDLSDRSEESWTDHVRRLANLGRLHQAEDACTTALDQYRGSAELTYLHAILLSEAGRHAAAAAAARRALYLDRTMIVAHLALGSALRRTGDMASARRAFTNAVALLDAMAPDAIVPASGGEPAARLTAAAQVQLSLAGSAA